MVSVSSPTLPSERRFGALFTVVFSLAGIYGHFVKDWSSEVVIGLFVASLVVAVVAIVIPAALAPFNKAWFQLGLLMGKVVSPIVLGLIFFGMLTPVGIIGRLLGREPDSFKNQF